MLPLINEDEVLYGYVDATGHITMLDEDEVKYINQPKMIKKDSIESQLVTETTTEHTGK